jgi:hypothetical protein
VIPDIEIFIFDKKYLFNHKNQQNHLQFFVIFSHPKSRHHSFQKSFLYTNYNKHHYIDDDHFEFDEAYILKAQKKETYAYGFNRAKKINCSDDTKLFGKTSKSNILSFDFHSANRYGSDTARSVNQIFEAVSCYIQRGIDDLVK